MDLPGQSWEGADKVIVPWDPWFWSPSSTEHPEPGWMDGSVMSWWSLGQALSWDLGSSSCHPLLRLLGDPIPGSFQPKPSWGSVNTSLCSENSLGCPGEETRNPGGAFPRIWGLFLGFFLSSLMMFWPSLLYKLFLIFQLFFLTVTEHWAFSCKHPLMLSWNYPVLPKNSFQSTDRKISVLHLEVKLFLSMCFIFLFITMYLTCCWMILSFPLSNPYCNPCPWFLPLIYFM